MLLRLATKAMIAQWTASAGTMRQPTAAGLVCDYLQSRSGNGLPTEELQNSPKNRWKHMRGTTRTAMTAPIPWRLSCQMDMDYGTCWEMCGNGCRAPAEGPASRS